MTASAYSKGYFLNPARSRYILTELLKTQVLNLPSGAAVLEIGCGDFNVLKQIERLRSDLDLHGVDVGDVPTSVDQGRIKFTKGDFKDYRPQTAFKLVLAIDILEHLAVPQELVRFAIESLMEEGHLYVCVPSVTKLLLLGDQNFYSDYTHVRPFNAKSLGRLLKDHGFQLETISSVGQGGIASLPRFLYYLSRGTFSMSANYINAAIGLVGGIAIEALAGKEKRI